MAVEVTNPNFGRDGHRDTLRRQIVAIKDNTRSLLNLSENKDVDDERPEYDPKNPDNQWPKMLHHAVKGEKQVGKNLKGMPAGNPDDDKKRAALMQANQKEYDRLIREEGYQAQPFPAVHVTVLDPKAEKAELERKNAVLQGQILTQQQDLNALRDEMARLAKMVSVPKQPEPPAA